MDKQDVLKKAQSQKRGKLDEMEVDILLRSNHVGLITASILCLVIMGIKMYLKQPYQDVYSVFCAVLCGQCLYKGIRLKNTSQTIFGALWGISALLLIIGYFI